MAGLSTGMSQITLRPQILLNSTIFRLFSHKQCCHGHRTTRTVARLGQGASEVSKRQLLLGGVSLVGLSLLPLSSKASGEKRKGLPIDDLKDIIQRDFTDGQYYITGKLTPEVFEDDCVFIDPTGEVKGVDFYSKAVSQIFDPKVSRVDLIDIKVSKNHLGLVICVRS